MTPLKSLTFLCLLEGPSDGVMLEMAPTMRNITYGGERYFRMDKVRRIRDGVEGGAYLWDRWTPVERDAP